jgi:hypothetical protein
MLIVLLRSTCFCYDERCANYKITKLCTDVLLLFVYYLNYKTRFFTFVCQSIFWAFSFRDGPESDNTRPWLGHQ